MNGLALGVAAALLISLTNVFSRLHFEAGSNPVTFLLGRYILFTAVLGFMLVIAGRLRRVPAGRAQHLIIAGTLNAAGASSLAFAIERLSVPLAITILYLFPVLTLILDSIVRRRRPSRVVVGALALAFAGLGLALGLGPGSITPDPLGIGFALGAAFFIAASFVWIEHQLGDVSDGMRLFGLTAVGLGFAVGLALVQGGVVWPFPSAATWTSFIIATASFGLATAAMFTALSRIGASMTSMLMNLEPPATVVLAAVLLGDYLAPSQLAGIALVLVAIVAAQRSSGSGPAVQ